MNHLTIRLRQRQGFAVILAVFLLLAFSVLGYTALNILTNKTDINIKTLASIRAFYLAQAAKNFYLEYYVPWGTDLTNTTQFPNLTGGLAKSFTVGSSVNSFSLSLSSRAQRSCTINFTGTAGGAGIPATISRTIIQDFSSNIPDYFSGAFLSAGGCENYLNPNTPTELTINNGTNDAVYLRGSTRLGPWSGNCYCGGAGCVTGPIITGNVVVNGDAEVNNTRINGNITASGNIFWVDHCPSNDTISGTITSGSTTIQIPQKPAIDQTYYNTEINIAQQQSTGNVSLSGPLDGQNRYINGVVTISGDISGGPANIVATNYIEINQNVKVEGRIALISEKGISTISQGATIGGTWSGNTCSGGPGVLLYARNAEGATDPAGIYSSGDDSAVSTWVRIKGTLLSPTSQTEKYRHIQLNGATVLYGVVHAKSVQTNFGTVRGSVAIDGPIHNTGQSYGSGPYLLRRINITYTSTEIPISIKGLYNVTGTNWRQQ